MDKASFLNLIDNRKGFFAEEVESVKAICEKYPYFTAAKIQELLMLNRQLLEFNSKLLGIAALVADRKNLHNILNSRPAVSVSSVADNTQETLASNVTVEPTNSHENYSESISTEETIEFSLFNELTETPESAEDIVNFEIVSGSDDDEQVSFLEVTSPESSLGTQLGPKESNFIDAQLYTLEIPGEFIDDGNYTSLMPSLKVEALTEKQEVSLEVSDTKAEPKGVEPQSLIDYFIETNPRIEKPKPIDPNAEIEDISLSSLKEPDDVASEQLAIIYRAQGLHEKAITIYEKLCLKFPEKRVYFAGQIESIKNQLKE
jgi:hypothetical protein